MDSFALLVVLQARPEKEQEVQEFLKSARPLVLQEAGTTTWYAIKMGGARYGIFDTFPNDADRKAHLTGEVAKALFARAEELFEGPPQIDQLEILASKAP